MAICVDKWKKKIEISEMGEGREHGKSRHEQYCGQQHSNTLIEREFDYQLGTAIPNK